MSSKNYHLKSYLPLTFSLFLQTALASDELPSFADAVPGSQILYSLGKTTKENKEMEDFISSHNKEDYNHYRKSMGWAKEYIEVLSINEIQEGRAIQDTVVSAYEEYLTTDNKYLFTCSSFNGCRIRNENGALVTIKKVRGGQLILDNDKFYGLERHMTGRSICSYSKNLEERTELITTNKDIEQFIINKDKIYALCKNLGAALVIDKNNGQILKEFKLGVKPNKLVIDPMGSCLFVTHESEDGLRQINLETDEFLCLSSEATNNVLYHQGIVYFTLKNKINGFEISTHKEYTWPVEGNPGYMVIYNGKVCVANETKNIIHTLAHVGEEVIMAKNINIMHNPFHLAVMHISNNLVPAVKNFKKQSSKPNFSDIDILS